MTEKRRAQSDRLVQAAYELVAEVGLSGLRTRDIAEKAGVNLATAHYCFASKDALLRALYHSIVAQFRAGTEQESVSEESPRAMQEAHTRRRIHFLRDMPQLVRVWRAFVGEAWTNPADRQIIRGHVAEQRERLAQMIALGRRSGEFSRLPTEDDRLAASLLISLYDGMMFQAALDPEAFSPEDFAHAIGVWLGDVSPRSLL